MFTISHEDMYAAQAQRERDVARMLLEQARSEAPVVGAFIIMRARRIVRTLSAAAAARAERGRRQRAVRPQREAL